MFYLAFCFDWLVCCLGVRPSCSSLCRYKPIFFSVCVYRIFVWKNRISGIILCFFVHWFVSLITFLVKYKLIFIGVHGYLLGWVEGYGYPASYSSTFTIICVGGPYPDSNSLVLINPSYYCCLALTANSSTKELILDGNLEYVTHTWRKIGLFGENNPICDCSRSKQKP